MSKWFAIQLVVSDRPFNLDSMPRLDVFTLYRLYAIQGRLGTNACHALRLGFFSEQQLARKICEDMHALFRFASVVQVSAAEQARFEQAPKQEALPQKPPVLRSEVVPINSARPAAPIGPQPKYIPAVKKPASTPQGRKKFKSLNQQLMEEARQIERAKSGKHAAAQTGSWFSRWLGRSPG